jgi:rod shape-determining protein MreC
MNWLNFDLRKAITTAILIVLPLISINTQQSPSRTGWYDKPFSFISGLIENGFFSFSDGVRGTTKMYLDLIDLKVESKNLKIENQSLKAQILAMDELRKENERLSQLLAFKHKAKMELISARVMSKDLFSDHQTLRIDKGKSHGLKAGMAVITTEGVVGHIFRPEAFTSHILLIHDRYSVVDGLVARSRSRGIVEGKSKSSLQLRYVEKSEDVKKDDIIVTSGIDNIFPKGFPVAIVENVENKAFAVSLKVDLRPLVDPDKVEEVFIIANANQQDMSDRITLNAAEAEKK